MQGMGLGGMGGLGGGMMGMGGGGMNMGGGMMGMGGVSPLQRQLLAEFGALPVNGSISGMSGFAGKTFGGFNGGKGL